jgi:hypothetical protein
MVTEQGNLHAGSLFTDDDATVAAAPRRASLLLCSLVHLTGDCGSA